MQGYVDQPSKHHRSSTATHDDIAERFHADASFFGDGNGFGGNRGVAHGQKIVDEFDLMGRADSPGVNNQIRKAIQHRPDFFQHCHVATHHEAELASFRLFGSAGHGCVNKCDAFCGKFCSKPDG